MKGMPKVVGLGLLVAATATAANIHSRQHAMRHGSKPRLLYQETPFNLKLIEKLPILQEVYERIPWLWNGHVETIFASQTRKNPNLEYNRRLVELEDGGVVALDFEPIEMDKGLKSDAPVLLIIPGLTGGSKDSYVQYTLEAARNIGIRGMVFNPRGIADSPVLTPKIYSASYTGDLRTVVQEVAKWYPNSKIMAVGFSLGANLLVNYLGEEGEYTPLTAAASLCNPHNLVISDKAVSSGFGRLYANRLGTNLSANFARHRHLFEGLEGGYQVERGATCKTIRDYDEAITIHSFGWPSVDAYYQGASCDQRLSNVRIPLLAVQAEDDVLALAEAIPEEVMRSNPHCILVRTPGGGHLGWVRRDDIFGPPWSDIVVSQFFAAVLEAAHDS